MTILICNVGSTSLKYRLFDMDDGERELASGGAERVGQKESVFYTTDTLSGKKTQYTDVFPTHLEVWPRLDLKIPTWGSKNWGS